MKAAKQHANVVLRLGFVTSIARGVLFAGVSFFVSKLYPKVGGEVLRFAVEGILIVACFQPAKVLNGIFGNGLLATGGDTKFVLMANLLGTCAFGLPLAIFLGLFTSLGLYGVFLAKGADEITKLVCFFWRYRTPAWYQKSLRECAPAVAEKEAKDAADVKVEELRVGLETTIEQRESTLGDLTKRK